MQSPEFSIHEKIITSTAEIVAEKFVNNHGRLTDVDQGARRLIERQEVRTWRLMRNAKIPKRYHGDNSGSWIVLFWALSMIYMDDNISDADEIFKPK